MEKKFNDKNSLFKNKDFKLKIAFNKYNTRSKIGNIKINSQYSFPLIEDNSVQNLSDRLNFLNINKSEFESNKNNKDKHELDSEIFKEIKILWKELGIKKEYQEELIKFLVNIKNLEQRNKYITLEKNSLMQLKANLMKYMNEKKIRTKSIKLLKQLNNEIYISLIKEKKINSSLIKQIIDCIKDIRISSINLVKSLIKIRENLAVFFTNNKINCEVLYNNFLFDNNYLLKMNFELQFLKGSQINKIFILNDEENIDTFLTTYTKVKNNEEKFVNNLSQEILNAIEKCRFYIYQEGILNKLYSLNNIPSDINKKKKIFLLSKKSLNQNKCNEFSKTPIKNHLDKGLQTIKSNLGRNYGKLFFQSFKKIKIPKNISKKNDCFTLEPKKKFINIERESINNGKISLWKSYIKGENDDIKIKREEKLSDLTNLNIEHTEILNIFSNHYNLDNTNEYNEKVEDRKAKENNNNIILNNIEENKNNQVNNDTNKNNIIAHDLKDEESNKKEKQNQNNEIDNYNNEKIEDIAESNKNNN